jgi:LmbE family N-acetylglucosaminyl deacetylase
MNILAFGAHNDDWDEYCGGTLKLYAQAGNTVGVVSMTNGCNYGAARSSTELGRINKQEFESAASLLGPCKTYWPDSTDGHLENNFETRKIVARIINEFQPDVIFTHPPNDYHADHNATTQLVLDASHAAYILAVGPILKFPGAVLPKQPLFPPYPVVYFYDSEDGHGFLPDDYVDITSVWETKRNIMDCHRSQNAMEVEDLNGCEETPLTAICGIIGRYRGLQSGVKYAEAFKLYRAAGRVHPCRLLP